MSKADISLFENLQANAHDAMGLSDIGVFNEATDNAAALYKGADDMMSEMTIYEHQLSNFNSLLDKYCERKNDPASPQKDLAAMRARIRRDKDALVPTKQAATDEFKRLMAKAIEKPTRTSEEALAAQKAQIDQLCEEISTKEKQIAD